MNFDWRRPVAPILCIAGILLCLSRDPIIGSRCVPDQLCVNSWVFSRQQAEFFLINSCIRFLITNPQSTICCSGECFLCPGMSLTCTVGLPSFLKELAPSLSDREVIQIVEDRFYHVQGPQWGRLLQPDGGKFLGIQSALPT